MQTSVALTINGKEFSESVDPRTLLLDFLRETAGLTGSHMGCDTAQCGACTVLLNDKAVKACSMLAVQASGAKVTTIEGLADGETMHPLQQSFEDCHALQCGFCTPGMVMSAVDLLANNASPTDQEIIDALEGNICRCTGYNNIIAAVRQAADQTA